MEMGNEPLLCPSVFGGRCRLEWDVPGAVGMVTPAGLGDGGTGIWSHCAQGCAQAEQGSAGSGTGTAGG